MNPNPVFESVTGLTNTTFDPSNRRSGQMATEDQLMALENRATALQRRINECCRDLCIWKTYLRIVEEKTGLVVSDFFDNMKVGHTRRGVPFTVEFAREFDESKFIMNRSASDRVGAQYINFRITTTGNGSNGKTTCFENGMRLMQDDYYENSTAPITGMWPKSSCATTIGPLSITNILNISNNSVSTRSLPQTITARDNIYHVYLDQTDNKIKIDILGKNQFEYGTESAYDTFFATQWVLKEGATL